MKNTARVAFFAQGFVHRNSYGVRVGLVRKVIIQLSSLILEQNVADALYARLCAQTRQLLSTERKNGEATKNN